MLNLRADGIPLRGVNWWPLFDTVQWEYREETSQPLEAFIRPGGWNNGLYVSQAQGGDLARVHTPAADRYKDIIRRDRTAAGLVQAPPRRGNSPEAAAIMMAKAVNWEPSDAPNTPIGTAQGIFPGRVTWIRDVRVAPWDGKTGRWWEDGNINQPVLNDMFAKSLNALTGKKHNEQAWDALFRHYNAKQGRGSRGWQAGEQIAIKINMNNSGRTDQVDNRIDQSTHGLRALLAQLTGPGKVDPASIVVFDASRVITDRLYTPLHAEFPAVRWVNRAEAPGREAPQWVENAISYTSPEVQLGNALPKCCADATYLVNMALLKGHEISGVTLCAKNHFGSIQYPSRDHNKYVPQYSRPMTAWNGYVDLMGAPNLGGKTFLYIIDGVYATQTNVREPAPDRDRFNRLFNGEWSAMLLMSQDPVAIDSVGLDFLRAEYRENLGFSGAASLPKGSIVNSDNFLHEAALGRNAQLGPYRPGGQEIGSLGAHEHWNNETEKKYSRNLDPKKGKGVELVKVGV
ncbi:MAG: DUF362 domain-containing protein [Gemmatimonadetes bacterium]|nr:DUF362 domain-containing protein [Gemmatimonadota bacterium]